jgi:hypothetical protein
MNNGENTGGLRKIADMSRVISLVVLFLNFYYYCYGLFDRWKLTTRITDRIMVNIEKTGLFDHLNRSKLIALAFLTLSLLGSQGRKDEHANYKTALGLTLGGLAVYFGSGMVSGIIYMILTFIGYILVLTGGARLSRVFRYPFNRDDVFNRDNAGFPQETKLIRSDYSINLPAQYQFKEEKIDSWINIINPRRGVLVLGSPGSGKSWFIIENMIRQFMAKGFALFVYDFKYDALTRLVYTQYLKHRHLYPPASRLYSINFTDLSRSHRCNLLDPSTMKYTADAIGASRTLFLSINRGWVHRQGDFFVESPINFFAAIIWWLRKYENGKFCTLPHAIELSQAPIDKLFKILADDKGVSALIGPFIQAYENKTMEMLDGQIASAKIPLARLASPEIYYVLTGNDFGLNINDRNTPLIFCLGGDPQKQEALAPILSLYIDRLNKQINSGGRHPCAMICDEFATVRAAGVLTTIATARSNNIVPVIAVQDLSQLRTQYSREESDLVLNITGNLVCGQVGGDTARWVAERFPQTMQDRTSMSINTNDVSINRSRQLEKTITPATIANLSSGEFLGIVADDPGKKLKLKAFHGTVINDSDALDKEKESWVELPVVREVDQGVVMQEFYKVKEEVERLVNEEVGRIAAKRGKG